MAVTTVVGVVQPGTCGIQLQSEQWTLLFKLGPWRVAGAPLQSEPLKVTRRCSEAEFHALKEQLQSDRVMRVQVKLSEDSPPRAELAELLGEDTTDGDLLPHANALEAPVTLHDPFFGELTLDRSVDVWRGAREWDGHVVTINLTPDNQGDLTRSLALGRQLWADQAGWNRRIRDFAVQQLLGRKNGSWLEEGEAELSAEEFKSRMTLEEIALDPEGSFEFWHDDGDLFWGHTIAVSGTIDDGPTDADIPG